MRLNQDKKSITISKFSENINESNKFLSKILDFFKSILKLLYQAPFFLYNFSQPIWELSANTTDTGGYYLLY